MFTNIYFIGIGGIGMSALARYFKYQGHSVSGYDSTPSTLTQALSDEGIAVHYEDRPDLIPFNKDKTLVIYTPAVPETLGEMIKAREEGYTMLKRSRALGQIAMGNECLAIAGTHGKTTTSTLLSHIMTVSEVGCTAFLGGISKNYHSNLILSHSNVIVAEADEFDRSFLQLYPKVAAITSIDADHLDIYGDKSQIDEAFSLFASQIKGNGALIIKKGVEIDESKISAKVYRYSYDEPCDFYASNIKPTDGGKFRFTLNHPNGKIENCTVGIPGWVNVENAIAASAVALTHGVSQESIVNALASYQGVERRFDIHLNTPHISYIDDYAHHPKEIAAAISSMRNIFKGRKLCGIFQPHLFSRTRDFADEFAQALSLLDELILLPIYPARELPIEGVTSSLIFDKVTLENKVLIDREEIMSELEGRDIDCLVTFGAGNIDRFVKPIEQMLKARLDV